MKDEVLDSFYLVGGTALALRLQHRKSVDIDLFIDTDFDSASLASHIDNSYDTARTIWEENTLRVSIDGIKVELLSHKYPLLAELENIGDIRIASLKDLAAFKLNAVSGRGSKKDFWDLEMLLNHFSLAEMLDFFNSKYATYDLWHLLRSLTYFDDAEREQIEIMDLSGKNWDYIKEKIRDAAQNVKIDREK